MSGQEHIITNERLNDLDALYEETEDLGILGKRRTSLNTLVDELRSIRRLVESSVTVKIEGTDTILSTWQDFYNWAHSRYHMLEDGADRWIGDDN